MTAIGSRRQVPGGNEEGPPQEGRAFERFRRRPTLPRRNRRSTIGAGGFHFRVRDGNGWDTSAIATENCTSATGGSRRMHIGRIHRVLERGSSSKVVKPHGQLVQVSFTHCCASTSCLSTLSSSTDLQGLAPREISSSGGLPAYMLSAVIPSVRSYPAVPLA